MPSSGLNPAACSVGAISVIATSHGFMRWMRHHRQAGLLGALLHFRIDVRRDDLIERAAVGQHRLRQRRHHHHRIAGLVDIDFFDERLRFGERLVDRRAERIEIRRQHVQRSEQSRPTIRRGLRPST